MATIRERSEKLAGRAVAPEKFRVEKFENSTGAGAALYIYDQIGGWEGVHAKDVVGALRGLTGPVNVHINSGGGDIFEGAAIHNAIKNYAGEVTVRIDGVAASAASFIAMAGNKIIIEPNASMMIHDGSALCVGNASDMRDAAELLDLLSNNIAEMYASRAGGTAATWRKKMKDETWYNAREALAAKLVDEISGQSSGAPQADFDLSAFDYAAPTTELVTPSPVLNSSTDVTTSPETAIDVDGLREALKGVFA